MAKKNTRETRKRKTGFPISFFLVLFVLFKKKLQIQLKFSFLSNSNPNKTKYECAQGQTQSAKRSSIATKKRKRLEEVSNQTATLLQAQRTRVLKERQNSSTWLVSLVSSFREKEEEEEDYYLVCCNKTKTKTKGGKLKETDQAILDNLQVNPIFKNTQTISLHVLFGLFY